MSVLAVSLGACGIRAPIQPLGPTLEWGVYAGPGANGVSGAQEFARRTHTPVTRLLDFLPDTSWQAMTHADWLLAAHAGTRYAFELSVPMLPRRGGTSLSDCARGAYNQRWQTIAQGLRHHHLGSSTIRPGWEFNGDWYRWSAAGPGQAASYAGCYRQLVTSMRQVAPTLQFSWSVNVGPNQLPAELGWPGDAYVDTVGVDVYDYSDEWYPPPAGTTLDEARTKVWQSQLEGDHGLRFWVQFARQHDKSMGLSEWGLAWRADGHAGGDNAYFLDQLTGFVRDPADQVAYATYFNSVDTPDLRHNLLGRNTAFPEASRRYSQLVSAR